MIIKSTSTIFDYGAHKIIQFDFSIFTEEIVNRQQNLDTID